MARLELNRDLSRRAVLQAWLGASAAACARTRTSTGAVEATLQDQFLARGHLLRGPLPPVSPGPAREVDVLIIGGGVAGASALWRLRGAGLDQVLLVELDTQVGGTSRSGNSPVTPFPWGAHYLPAPLQASGSLGKLLSEMGLLAGTDAAGRGLYAEGALVRAPDERLFYRGRWYEGLYLSAGATAEDRAELERFLDTVRTLSLARDGRGRRAFDLPMESSSDDGQYDALDALSMAAWLDAQGFRSPRLRAWIDYACRDDFGGTLAQVSAWAGLWYFAARREGDDGGPGYLAFPEGNSRFVAHLLGGARSVETGTLVRSLVPIPGGWRAVSSSAPDAVGEAIHARQVVLATPQFVARRLLGHDVLGLSHDYAPWVVANVHVESPLDGDPAPRAWDSVFWNSPSVGYVVATHQRERALGEYPTVLSWYYPVCDPNPAAARRALLSSTAGEWSEVVLSELARAHPNIREATRRVDVLRWGHGMVRPSPGFLARVRKARARPRPPGLHFAHTDLSGMALFEEAHAHGVQAAEAALAQLGRYSASWL